METNAIDDEPNRQMRNLANLEELPMQNDMKQEIAMMRREMVIMRQEMTIMRQEMATMQVEQQLLRLANMNLGIYPQAANQVGS